MRERKSYCPLVNAIITRGVALALATLTGALILGLSACAPGINTSPTSTTASTITDYRQPTAAEQAVDALLEAAGTDKVLSIKVQKLGVTIQVVGDSDDEAVEYSVTITDPEAVQGPTAAGEHHWYDSPMPVTEIDWAATLRTEKDCADPLTMIHTIGFATKQVTTSCQGRSPVTTWLADGSLVTLDVTDPAQLQSTFGRLTSGSHGQVRAVSVASGDSSQLYVTLADGRDSRILQMVDGGVGSAGERPAQSSTAFSYHAFNADSLVACAKKMANRLDQEDWMVTVQSASGSLIYRWGDGNGGAVVTSANCEPS